VRELRAHAAQRGKVRAAAGAGLDVRLETGRSAALPSVSS
jgi:hypothetical protein